MYNKTLHVGKVTKKVIFPQTCTNLCRPIGIYLQVHDISCDRDIANRTHFPYEGYIEIDCDIML